MNLNDLLLGKDIDPSRVLVFRHRPNEPELNRVLPWLAVEKPQLFNAYQQTQGKRVEQAMQAMTENGYLASFIGHQPGMALFVGLFAIGKSRPLSREEFWRVPAYIELKPLGMRGFADENPKGSVLWFDLELTDFYAHWKGKLIVGWPPPERSWWRRAHRNEIPVLAVLEDSAFDPANDAWDDMEFTWDQLRILPKRLRSRLSEWRGVYFIFDVKDGKGYVGSAYGESNLLGRWLSYAARGDGGNKLLRQRDPRNFRFTILERVSPDMRPAEVIRLENSWKRRLHTNTPDGLNNN
ncbi:MAG TPA: GIY-YIG nuclease family protein [Pyrinomonadaceae bacterium]|nr:GIY-YIG nuclease family protein [Pyrinomonadaceae bacterium]